LKLSAVHRSTTGVSVNGSYTLSRCFGTAQNSRFTQANAGYVDPSNPAYDAGYCDQDRKHLTALSLGYETPELDNAALRVALSNWRLSGILTAQSGARLNIVSGLDNVFNGIANQRPNKVSDDFYGGTLTNYLNRAAFAQPAAGTFGDLTRNAAVGPDYWNFNLALSRLIPVSNRQLEMRFEVFNLFNRFNWGLPVVNVNSGQFGRITTQAGTPRIMQLGIKFDF